MTRSFPNPDDAAHEDLRAQFRFVIGFLASTGDAERGDPPGLFAQSRVGQHSNVVNDFRARSPDCFDRSGFGFGPIHLTIEDDGVCIRFEIDAKNSHVRVRSEFVFDLL
jgi:hypothetical protein